MFTSCVKVKVAVLGSPSLTVRTVSVDVKQHCTVFRSCVKVEVAVLVSLTVRTVYVDDDDELMLNVLRCQFTY